MARIRQRSTARSKFGQGYCPCRRYLNVQSVYQLTKNVTTKYGTGYKEFNTGRKYLAKMGDWRDNKDDEVPLDGVGGVNILVKADVHRSGMFHSFLGAS